MLLKEISTASYQATYNPTPEIEGLSKRGFILELVLTDQFTRNDAKAVALKLGGKIVDEQEFPPDPFPERPQAHIVFDILFPTEQEKEYAKKTLRRLQRGKPKFEIYDVSDWNNAWVGVAIERGLLSIDENVNPGSGSPIRAGSLDLTPLTDKQKHQLASRKGKYWRMSVRELKDALMRHRGDSREIGKINRVLKAKREKREELSKITQPIDSWIGGGGY